MQSLQKIKSELELFHVDTDKSQYDKLCQENKYTDKLIGFSMLMVELELNQIIKGQISELIDKIFQLILNIQDEKDIYRSLSCLEIILKKLYKDTEIPKPYIQKLESLKSETKSMKIRFKVMDILE
jgi:hypothetical protein